MGPSKPESSATARDLGDSSSATSPADTRNPLRTEPSTHDEDDGLSESFQSTDTVRRRPEGNYGSIGGPATSSTTPAESSLDRAQPRTSQASRKGPERVRSVTRLRRPNLARRPSSKTPYRGSVFSVDDEPHEVMQDASDRQQYGTRRRPPLTTQLSRVQSRQDENDDTDEDTEDTEEAGAAEAEEANEEDPSLEDHVDCDSDGEVSDAESFTLKDRQQAINQTHPFGIRVWKPALYKKDRSIQKFAQQDIHSAPGGRVSNWLVVFNLLWTILFGWWMAALPALGAITCLLFSAAPSGREYGTVLWGLAGYLFYPFGKFVRLEKDEAYLDEDQHEGRSISEYEQWQNGDIEYGRLFFGPDRNRSIIGRSRRSIDSEPSETESLLGRGRRGDTGELPRLKRRLFGRGQWNIGRIIFFVFFYFLISPSLILVSGICWMLVFWIPMGKTTFLLFDHLRRHPLAMTFESDIRYARMEDAPSSTILVCTYRAVGSKYWKYTVDGTNIFLINLMSVVVFVIFDWIVLEGILHVDSYITSPSFLFMGGLLSIIPLAYFIGQAVASISAQSSMGVGAAINAFFATVVEVFLYCVALTQGKGRLVEGSIVGSIFAGILFLPGISMCFGALKRKTQRFNARSAGVTSTMLLFAVVGAFGPTLFYQIYGTHELNCLDCEDFGLGQNGRDCRRCYFSQSPSLSDRFYLEAVRPYCYMAATLLFLSYLIGLWFTLRTHAAVIWNAEIDEKRHEEHMHASSVRPSQAHTVVTAETSGTEIRDSHLYKRILGQSLKQVGLNEENSRQSSSAAQSTAPQNGAPATPHVVPPRSSGGEPARSGLHLGGLSDADNKLLAREVAEIAATAAAIASRDRVSRRPSALPATPRPQPPVRHHEAEPTDAPATEAHAHHGGHDAPNWSRVKSAVILLGATLLYAVIAEILVDTVDVVLENFAIDQKFLGVTLFALVPNTTEFLNAISFAMNGNIALSMEIGSAYALQVCLLQIPALVFYSAFWPGVPSGGDPSNYTFSLLFPQWDMVTVILCVFLLSYMYGEGKSNYFKGSILMLTYLVVMIGYFYSGYTTDAMGMQRFDIMGEDGNYQSFKTIGRSTRGPAFQA
ncbi:Sodium/calcium exchanger protein-domain-containing protein [Dactylonectria estremocensis]|uniref:Sodium/calcium exchanger protein-domain-containing protein n=1 Tax=Dactylonectria estremocensis TaxID=1079267 RepID=A0A9P9ITP6_9HYPO|nr:Sodium/calcium exchanger protein-domain-containing protein [Dactylonectria estremocensis]